MKRKCDYILQNIKNEIIIISGMARGADRLGVRYAEEKGYKVEKYYPDWDKHGKSAGVLRNIQMAKNADALIAFWDGKSKGTGHMIKTAYNLKLKVKVIEF